MKAEELITTYLNEAVLDIQGIVAKLIEMFNGEVTSSSSNKVVFTLELKGKRGWKQLSNSLTYSSGMPFDLQNPIFYGVERLTRGGLGTTVTQMIVDTTKYPMKIELEEISRI